jgi:long-chain acyl-CoA synthetase
VWREDDFPRTPILKIDRKAVRAAVERQATSQVDDAPQDQGESPSDPLLAIVHRVATRRIVGLNEDAELEADLGLDSIGRVELLSAVEEEMGRVVDETAVGPQTTASQLRSLIAQGSPSAAMVRRPRWMRAGWARAVGHALLWAAFRLQDRWMRIEVVHPERAQALPMPCILIFNYQGPYPALLLFRALPRRLRERVAVAMDSRLWEGSARWQGILAALAVQGFAFVKSGGAVRESLEETGRWLDDGYAVMVSPEGNPERNGELLPFLGGIGLMAVEMRVPVVPVRIEDYHALFPERQLFPYLPIRKGPVRVVFGEPLNVPRGISYQEATGLARQALIEAY